MISDILFDAIHNIAELQKTRPEAYDGHSKHIDLVKKVMASLLHALDQQPPFLHEPELAAGLTDEEKLRWRTCCEANIARWAEWLCLLEPVSPEELTKKLADAVERQEAMLTEKNCGEGDGSRKAFLMALHVWSYLGDVQPVQRRFESVLSALEGDDTVLPVDACEWLGLPFGSTYADGARACRDLLQGTGDEHDAPSSPNDKLRKRVLQLACQCWNEGATARARDALGELLTDLPHLAEELVSPIVEHSDFWLDQIARAAFGLPDSEDGEVDYDLLLAAGEKARLKGTCTR